MLTDACAGDVKADARGYRADGIEDRPDPRVRRAHIVQVFAVSAGRVHDELVQAGAPAEHQFVAQERMLGDLNNQSR